MQFRPFDDEKPFDDETRPMNGLWIPSKMDSQESFWDSVRQDTVDEINSVGLRPQMERHTEAHWTLNFPIELSGLFIRASAVKRPTPDGTDQRDIFSLNVMRVRPEIGLTDNPGYLTLEEITALRDFLSEVIRETRG